MIKMLTDLSLIPLGGLLGAIIIKISAKRSMANILDNLTLSSTSKDKKGARKMASPKTHGSGWWALAGTAAILLIIVEITRHIDALTPAWYFLK
jgi:hypothetical protein